MTDRESHAPHPAPPAPRPPAPPDHTHEGNGSLMSATIATRTLVRPQPALTDPADRGRAWVARLFAGDFAFPTVPLAALPAAERHPAEHDALSRAAGCRDLFVLHADRTTGERVIVELVRSTPDRVLILTPDPAAADHITERLLKGGVAAFRALADDENPTRPSPGVSKVTSAGLGIVQAERDRRAALAAVAAAEARIGAFAVVSKAVARLSEVNDLLTKLDADAADLVARRDRVEENLAAEAKGPNPTAYTDAFEKVQLAFTVEFNELCARKGLADEAVRAKDAEASALRAQHVGAAGKSGFFTRLFGKPKAGTDPDELKRHLDAVEAELVALKAVAATADATATARRLAFEADRAKVEADEIASRRGSASAALLAADAERERARAEVAALNKVIATAVPHDDYATAARELAAARARAAEAARAGPEALARAVALRAVVGTPGGLADPIFATLPDDPPFGLLVLDRAEELPETEFPRLARLADRWVLVGDTAPRDGRPRAGRPAEVPFACRVARYLDRETWAPEGDRLVCRLLHLSPEQRRHVTREPLTDRPEIELRFIDSGGEPLLAEIAFPGATEVPDAKSFLFRALGEVLLRPCGEAVWVHAPGAIAATFPLSDGPRATWIDLEPGVREKVSGAGLFAYTAAVSFDPAAGWDADRAAEWLAAHLPPPPIGRFAAVPRTR